jgi:hypothetical protein
VAGPINYDEFETPPGIRQQQRRAVGDGLAAEPVREEMLDIPAFLRRQAD